MSTTHQPISGNLSLDTQDGTTLTARTDIALARAWARHESGEQWDSMTRGEQANEVGAALTELRRCHPRS